jgi:hypothetical protein
MRTCECCEMYVSEEVRIIRAKEIFPDICDIQLEQAHNCKHLDCDFCLDDEEGCAEFYACLSCISNTDRIKACFNIIRGMK